MRRVSQREAGHPGVSAAARRFEVSVENCKRRRALSRLASLDMDSRLFFERILNIRKIRDFVFIARASARDR